MSRRLSCSACDAYAFAVRRTDDGDLEVRCLECDDPPTRVLTATLRLREPDPPPEPDPAVEERLREWRSREARDRGVPAYVVLHDRTIEELAREEPGTEGALAQVHGIGPATLDRYREDLLEFVDETREATPGGT